MESSVNTRALTNQTLNLILTLTIILLLNSMQYETFN